MNDFKPGAKPHQLHKEFGPKVELTTESLGRDEWAETNLRAVGSALAQGDMEYLGSYAVHVYASPVSDGLSAELDTITQTSLAGVSEKAVGIATQNAVIALARYFGREYKTRDPQDLRGQS